MLNTAKGPAVHSLRAQADKQAYQNRMRQALMSQPHLTLRQGEVDSIETENGRVMAGYHRDGAAHSLPCGGDRQRGIPGQPHHHRGRFLAGRAPGAGLRHGALRRIAAAGL